MGGREAVKGWKIRNSTDIKLMIEKDFTGVTTAERARLSCSAAVERMEVERLVRGLSESRYSLLRLFADDVLLKCKTWQNEYATLHKLPVGPIKMRDMYRYYATMLLSHFIGFSLSKTGQILSDSSLKCGELSTVLFISSNLLAFAATGRGFRHSISKHPERKDATSCAV